MKETQLVKQQFQILPQEDIPMSVTLSEDMSHSDKSDPLASMDHYFCEKTCDLKNTEKEDKRKNHI